MRLVLSVLLVAALGALAAGEYYNFRRIDELKRAISELRAAIPRSGSSSVRSIGRLPAAPMAFDAASAMGSENALLGMILYSDFQCPYCGRFAQEIFPRIDKAFISTGSLRLSFRHLPLKNHPAARPAAEAAECAARQGRFWAMHDRLFQDNVTVSGPTFELQARLVGLDVVRFRACMGGEASARIDRDVEEARQLGITSTPTFLIGDLQADGRFLMRKSVVGAQPFEVFDRLMREMIATK